MDYVTPAKAPEKPPTKPRRQSAIQRARPLHEEVVDRLRDMIIEGDLAIGERLHEFNLAETLNVSRTPIREALKLLSTEGLVDLLPGRGARVRALSAEKAVELFEVISGMERLAVELAIGRMKPREFEKLQRMHDRMAVHHAAGERHDYFKLNHEIHVGIVALSKNAILETTHAALMVQARRGRYIALASKERWIEAMAEHEELMTAMAARNSELAGKILFEHDSHTGNAVRDVLKASEER